MKAMCEVCGAPLRASPNRVEIDGAIMVVCDNCARLGKQIGPAAPAVSIISNRVQRSNPIRSYPAQGALRAMAQRPAETEYEVDPEYYLLIRQAREKLGLSQEQLGKLLNEKPSVIKMVESKKLKPDVTLTRKLMHELKINLLVSLSELEGGRPTGI
ncbi:MAG TPA: multiprotein bridging factor aMBF1 [Nitrososphaerales archaeon]|nr:multiprotein bridging factor aMBF1 [Nitrososphaerales archaeon]